MGRAGLWTSVKRPRRAELQLLSLQRLPLRHGTALAAVMRRDGSADFTLGNTSWPEISAICPLARPRSNSARCRTTCAFLASTMTLKQVSTTTETCAILWKPEDISYSIPLALIFESLGAQIRKEMDPAFPGADPDELVG